MHELKRFDVLSVGKIAGITYGLLAVLFIPLFLIMAVAGFFAQDKEAAIFGGIMGVIFAVAMPFFYGAIGFVFGCIGALIYNLVARRIGGLRFEVQPTSAAPASTALGAHNG